LAAELSAGGADSLLRDKRIGIARSLGGFHPGVDARFDDAVARFARAGATLVDGLALERPRNGEKLVLAVLGYEFKRDLNAYLATLPAPFGALTLGRLIAFNREHASEELADFGQDLFEAAEGATVSEDDYRAARERLVAAARRDGIDALMSRHGLAALIAPTAPAAWTIDPINGDHFLGGSSSFAAIAGYPHLSVPNGAVRGLPVGLSIFGRPADRDDLFRIARAYEVIGPPRPLAD
jgi:amidase